MRNQGKIKLGFYPLPIVEAGRLKNYLIFQEQFSAVDPCIGDGVAFSRLLEGTSAHCYGIEIDAHRAEQAKALGICTVQANALDVRCPAESISLLYLNPPYDFEAGTSGWSGCSLNIPTDGSSQRECWSSSFHNRSCSPVRGCWRSIS
jgi:hypothetical protein